MKKNSSINYCHFYFRWSWRPAEVWVFAVINLSSPATGGALECLSGLGTSLVAWRPRIFQSGTELLFLAWLAKLDFLFVSVAFLHSRKSAAKRCAPHAPSCVASQSRVPAFLSAATATAKRRRFCHLDWFARRLRRSQSLVLKDFRLNKSTPIHQQKIRVRSELFSDWSTPADFSKFTDYLLKLKLPSFLLEGRCLTLSWAPRSLPQSWGLSYCYREN